MGIGDAVTEAQYINVGENGERHEHDQKRKAPDAARSKRR